MHMHICIVENDVKSINREYNDTARKPCNRLNLGQELYTVPENVPDACRNSFRIQLLAV
jgi:hypothetical protein